MKQNGKSMKNNKKKRMMWLAAGIVAFVVAAAVIVGWLLLKGGSDKKEKKDGTQANTMLDLDNRIADLENEPVSDMDVIYKDKNSTSGKPYLIQVNKTQNCIIVYKKGTNGKYSEPERAMICSVGFDTPTGEFTTSDKYEWKIVNGNVWAQYATRVVGNVLIHSMPYMTNSKDSLLTDYYNQLGSTLSASCIRVSARDAEWIMKNCPAGTKVQVYESDAEEPLSRPQSILVPSDAQWDPTDPDVSNPYHAIQLAFEGIDSEKTVERGMQINYLDGITIKDTCGNDISKQVKITTEMDSFTLGSYEVHYSVEDAAGKTAEAVCTYNIVDTAPPQFSGLKSNMSFASVSDVTQDNILKGVSVIDNNELLDNSRVSVIIPAIVEGSNTVTLSVSDDYGNTTTVSINVIVHVKPPVISLKQGTETIIPLTQKVDQSFALARINVTNDGQPMDLSRVTVSITPTDWGYAFRYTATDENGYVGTLDDSVTYAEYRITVPKSQSITDITDNSQLLKGVTLKNNLGESLDNSVISVTTKKIGEGQYQIKYSYTYTSARGSRMAQASSTVTVQGTEKTPEPTTEPSSSPSPEPSESSKPSEEPSSSPEAESSEKPETQE